MEAAAKEAKAKYLERHPEAAHVELKTDVQDMVDNYNKFTKPGVAGTRYGHLHRGEYERLRQHAQLARLRHDAQLARFGHDAQHAALRHAQLRQNNGGFLNGIYKALQWMREQF